MRVQAKGRYIACGAGKLMLFQEDLLKFSVYLKM